MSVSNVPAARELLPEVVAMLKKKQGVRLQQELAAEIRVSPQFLSNVLVGVRKPDKNILNYLMLEGAGQL